METREDDFRRSFVGFDVGHFPDERQLAAECFVFQDFFQFLIAVVLEDSLQGLGMLVLSDGPVGLEHFLDVRVHVGFKGQVDEFLGQVLQVDAPVQFLLHQVAVAE